MIPLTDPRWKDLKGGYSTMYDASHTLKKLEEAHNPEQIDKIISELWDELHHQGDLGLASYFAIPHLLRIAREKNLIDPNILGLVAVIEINRHKDNPQVPEEYLGSYLNSLKEIHELVIQKQHDKWDLSFTASALSAIAASKGQIRIAEALLNLDSEDVLNDFLGID